MSRYLRINQLITDLTFGWFMVSWLVTRHVLFLFVIRSTIFDGPMLITFIWDPANGRVVTKEMFYGFAGLLLALQVTLINFLTMMS
jgi:acyl-CoA-dependent ceramide synthase